MSSASLSNHDTDDEYYFEPHQPSDFPESYFTDSPCASRCTPNPEAGYSRLDLCLQGQDCGELRRLGDPSGGSGETTAVDEDDTKQGETRLKELCSSQAMLIQVLREELRLAHQEIALLRNCLRDFQSVRALQDSQISTLEIINNLLPEPDSNGRRGDALGASSRVR